MRFLEKISYESLNTIGKLVESKKDILDIDEVIEQGLLKREGQNYQFIHLTFQEFLAARYLKNQLLDNHTKSKILRIEKSLEKKGLLQVIRSKSEQGHYCKNLILHLIADDLNSNNQFIPIRYGICPHLALAR